MIGAFDLSSRLCGFCFGDGSKVPIAGAFELPATGDDLGWLLFEFDKAVNALVREHGANRFVVEAPILNPRRDKLLTIRKLYAINAHLEFIAYGLGIPCNEVDLRAVKRELAGFTKADKADIVAAAMKMGLELPATDSRGRKDAADAAGVWLIGVRHYARQHQARWDRVLYGQRGALL